MADEADESTKLIETIETKLTDLDETEIEQRVRIVVKEMMVDMHERFRVIEKAVGIAR